MGIRRRPIRHGPEEPIRSHSGSIQGESFNSLIHLKASNCSPACICSGALLIEETLPANCGALTSHLGNGPLSPERMPRLRYFKKVEMKICTFQITEPPIRSSWTHSSRIWVANVCVLWIQPAIRFHALRPNLRFW